MGVTAVSLLLSMPLSTLTAADPVVPMEPALQLSETVDFRGEAEAVSLVADEASLQALALRIEAMSGIHVVIAPGLSQAVVNVRVASPNWVTALQELFRDYSTVVAWDRDGEIRSFYVLSSAQRDPNLKVASSEAGPVAGLRKAIPPVIAEIAPNPGSAPQTAPEYILPKAGAEVLELMTAMPGSEGLAIEKVQDPQLKPEVQELLQRMRAVEQPIEGATQWYNKKL